jgi:preprotein translocase subunit SecF
MDNGEWIIKQSALYSPLSIHRSPLFFMIKVFEKVNINWLDKRRLFIGVSVVLMLAGLASAIIRQVTPGGTDAFNLGVDFKGGTVVTVKFKQRPTSEQIREALNQQGVNDAIIQLDASKGDEALIRLPQLAGAEVAPPVAVAPQPQASPGATPAAVVADAKAQVDPGRVKVSEALKAFGKEYKVDEFAGASEGYSIVGTDAVGPVAGQQLRNQAIAVTLAALVGILLYIGARFEWTYGIAAVIAVFHDVLVTLGVFSIFQWEVNLTVIAALLTLVGFSVNDTIVVFDRIRENLKLRRRDTLYNITNDSINQTLSRTVITSGLVFLSVLAMALFGGEVLRPFSLALVVGVIFGTYSSIAIASPIMVWWQQRLGRGVTAGSVLAEGESGGRARTRPRAKAAARS